MCKQAAEHGWLQPFRSKISKDWDITNIHVNKNSAAGIYADLVSHTAKPRETCKTYRPAPDADTFSLDRITTGTRMASPCG